MTDLHFTYDAPIAGEGHFIHTYMNDGSPLPSFEGEPVLVRIEGNIDTLLIWYGKILMKIIKYHFL